MVMIVLVMVIMMVTASTFSQGHEDWNTPKEKEESPFSLATFINRGLRSATDGSAADNLARFNLPKWSKGARVEMT